MKRESGSHTVVCLYGASSGTTRFNTSSKSLRTAELKRKWKRERIREGETKSMS